jgi:multimeric flavodoxin WrbA
MSKVRVLGVSGSPREDRNTDALLRETLEKAEEAGAETEVLTLTGLKILP